MAGPTLETLKWDNLALRMLPVDPNVEKTQRQVPGSCFASVNPTPVSAPRMVAMATSALALLDISPTQAARPEMVEFFSGNRVPPGAQPAAHCYAGHQFGYFSGQLGDGAAMYFGEIVNGAGERWEVQLKGAGLTPFSRTADGRKVLRSSIREFLCSEAMHGLGVPTTRAGCLVTSASTVVRDVFYDGRPREEQCAIVTRIAPTFIRFGSFEIFKPRDAETGRSGPSVGNTELLKKLLDYTVQTFYPEIWASGQDDKQSMFVKWFEEVVRRTARTVALWQGVGWCHGVLNTDNMSIVGVTIDYGPYGFMDSYDPDFICNGSDDGGRYTYRRQPEMCRWNCKKLAEAIQDVVPLSLTEPVIKAFDEEYDKAYMVKMRAKFGLKKELEEDRSLIDGFFSTMAETGADFTNSFRALSSFPLPSHPDMAPLRQATLATLVGQSQTLAEMKQAAQPRMDRRQLVMLLSLARQNPDLLAAFGRGAAQLGAELSRMERAQELEEKSESEIDERNKSEWNKWLDQYTARLQKEEEGVSDCSSLGRERVDTMNSSNPKVVLRNYLAQHAIERAENGDYTAVQKLLNVLADPYSEDAGSILDTAPAASVSQSSQPLDQSNSPAAPEVPQSSQDVHAVSDYASRPPAWATDLRVT